MKKYSGFLAIILFLINVGWSQTADDAIRIRKNEFGFGVRDLAMGGNGVALSNDYSSIYWNPAGLASLKNSEFMAVFSHLNFANDALFSGSTSSMSENYTRLRSLGLAVPLPTTSGSMVLAFGYNFVQDFDEYLFFSGKNFQSNGLEFELENGSGNYNWYSFDKNVTQTEEVTVEGGLHQWSFGAAVALSPDFDLGATMNFWSGQDKYRFNFLQVDDLNYYNNFPADFYSYSLDQNLVTDYKAFSLKLGGMIKLNRCVRLGLALEFPTTFAITENYSSSDELVFDDGYVDAVDYEPGKWEYKVKTPYRFDAGVGIQSGQLSLTASATYQDWTQTRFQAPDNATLDEDYSEPLDENDFLRKDYRETINYHLGGEFALPGERMFVRAGYAVYPSAFANASSDLDKKYYSGGIGFKAGSGVRFDVTFIRGNWKRQSEDFYTPGGTLEDITENRIFAGIRYNF